jgi:hypothetical protein
MILGINGSHACRSDKPLLANYVVRNIHRDPPLFVSDPAPLLIIGISAHNTLWGVLFSGIGKIVTPSLPPPADMLDTQFF